VEQRFRELYSDHEPHLREVFQKMPSLDLFPPDLQQKIKQLWLAAPLEYQQANRPQRANLEMLQAATAEIGSFIEKSTFERQKGVLEGQAALMRETK